MFKVIFKTLMFVLSCVVLHSIVAFKKQLLSAQQLYFLFKDLLNNKLISLKHFVYCFNEILSG